MKLKLLLINLGWKFFFIISNFEKWGEKTFIYNIGKKAKFRLRVNTSDKFTVIEVWESKEYIDSEFDIKKDDVVVDIGANIGAFSVLAAKKANNGIIFAYEPDKENYGMLLKNKFLNKVDNIFPFNLAISAKKGSIDFFTTKLNSNAHSVYDSSPSRIIKIKSNTLNDIFTTNKIRRINYLKIDAEGAEYDILLNTPTELIRKIDKIVLEYHDYLDHGHSYIELIRYLEKNRFKVELYGTNFLSIIGRMYGIGMIRARRLTT